MVCILALEIRPDLFHWVRDYEAFRLSLYFLTTVHCAFIILNEFVRGDWLYLHVVLNSWNAFHIVLVYLTGGIESPFVFMFAFPVAVSALYLDLTHSKYMAIMYTAVLALMILADPQHLHDPGRIVEHFFLVAAFGLLVYYIYNVVRETLMQRRQKERIQRDILQMSEISHVKDNFLTTMSHQLRTPLTGAQWGLTNLKSEKQIDNNVREKVADVKERVDESINIVDEILSTAESSGEGIKITQKPVDINDMIIDIMSELDYLITVNNVDTQLNLQDNCGVTGDEEMLRGAITNVIDNAIRYSPEETVAVTVECDDDTTTITVEDTGIGLTEKTQQHIYERFYRGKNAVEVDSDQSGVGMYVTHNIIKMHHGSISVESELSEGTTVTITLQRKQPGELTDDEA